MTESKSLLSTTFSLKYYMEIEKKKITHVARFPNIVAALFIFDNLLKVLKKKKRRRKVLLNEIIYKTIYIAIKLLSLFKKKKKILE